MKQQSTSKKSAGFLLRQGYGGQVGLPPSPRLRRTCQSAVSPPIPQSAIRNPHSQGFTLLELMTVMVIMFILMGMSTLALRGVMRGAGISGAIAKVNSVLLQARQQAIMKNQPTAVIFDQDGNINSMQVIISLGTVDSANPLGAQGFISVRDLPWTASQLNGSPVYNFEGEKGTLSVLGGNGGSYNTFGSSGGITWSEGDQIALAVVTAVKLPEGMAFDSGASFPVVVAFMPDGTSPGAGDELDLNLVEQNVASPAPIAIAVAESGLIEIGQPGGSMP